MGLVVDRQMVRRSCRSGNPPRSPVVRTSGDRRVCQLCVEPAYFAVGSLCGYRGGVFAPGHFGELTQQVPFEMVDEVLEATGAVQSRVRVVPARVVVYLLLAGALFGELGYRQVWLRLTAGLGQTTTPSPAGLTQARRRLGCAPVKALF